MRDGFLEVNVQRGQRTNAFLHGGERLEDEIGCIRWHGRIGTGETDLARWAVNPGDRQVIGEPDRHEPRVDVGTRHPDGAERAATD